MPGDAMASSNPAVQALVDRTEIHDALARYAHGVDRRDWPLVRSAYHPDAYDDHGDYKGGVEGLLEWLSRRFAAVNHSTHFVGNILIEFRGADEALVESSFLTSRRVNDGMCRQSSGRYLDQFERRGGEWRIARRTVRVETVYGVATSDIPGPQRSEP